MASYSEIMSYYKTVKVFVLTAPDKHERLLFYTKLWCGRPYRLIGRQIPAQGTWHDTNGLSSDELVHSIGNHIVTTKEKGNFKYLEFAGKGYIKSVSTLADVLLEKVK